MKIELAKTEVIHFVGIGGIGMSGLSLIMKMVNYSRHLNLSVKMYGHSFGQSGRKLFMSHQVVQMVASMVQYQLTNFMKTIFNMR